MGVTNTPSPGTDGAVCEMCDGEGQCIVATDGLKDSCPTCGGTGRAKADCAPVAADLPAGALAAQIESAAESWATVPDRYKGEPSKRDATEVRRFTGVYGFHFDPVVGAMPFDVVDASDHTAAIQASLAREAALEAERDAIAAATRKQCEDWYTPICLERAKKIDELHAQWAAVYVSFTAAESRLAAVEAERDLSTNQTRMRAALVRLSATTHALRKRAAHQAFDMGYGDGAWQEQYELASEAETVADAALKDASEPSPTESAGQAAKR